MNKEFTLASVSILLSLGMSACLVAPKSEDATAAYYPVLADMTVYADGLTAFEATLFPFARANCAGCHGGSQTPLFAAASSSSSYNTAKDPSYVDFNNPRDSDLARYSGNGHCGLPSCTTNESVVATLIESWARTELALAGGGNGGGGGDTGGGGPATGGVIPGATVTAPLAIPALTAPYPTAVVQMRWNLNVTTPAAPLLAGGVFQLDVQKLNAVTYRVRNPRIIGLRAAVRITGIHVYVRPANGSGVGTEDLGAGSVWSTLTVTAPASAANGNPAVLDAFSNIFEVKSSADVLTIAFDRLAPAIGLSGTFTSISANILVPKCVGCHSAAMPTAGVRYDTHATTVANSAGLVSTTRAPDLSMPPGSLKLSTPENNAIDAWIAGGRLNN